MKYYAHKTIFHDLKHRPSCCVRNTAHFMLPGAVWCVLCKTNNWQFYSVYRNRAQLTSINIGKQPSRPGGKKHQQKWHQCFYFDTVDTCTVLYIQVYIYVLYIKPSKQPVLLFIQILYTKHFVLLVCTEFKLCIIQCKKYLRYR
jgi:hypothetical protein